MNEIRKKLTPAEFYRTRRPEYFSDSQIIEEIKLPREVLSLEINNITTNQKENEFETMCRRLAEKFISPNLIPQVGPTGGGDGKTDSETYPVSSMISDRWFMPENGWEQNEKWAFAISAKKIWKSKAEDDIVKIIGTNREYTRIYFMTNQLPSSKKKKDSQDEFKDKYNIEVIILDGEWIIEKIYNNNLIDFVVDCLNLSPIYKSKTTIVGKNDFERIKRLEEIENYINRPSRYSEYDFQLVEDCLEAAVLSRMLERPRDEIEGKFDRAFRFCKKVNFEKQWIKLHYQRAWTYLNWFNDYDSFIKEYLSFKKHIVETTSIHDVQLYYNLYNLLKGSLTEINLSDFQLDLECEKSELLNLLDKFENNHQNPNSSLMAKTLKALLNLTHLLFSDQDLKPYFELLSTIFDECQGLLDYPFETYKSIVEELGKYINSYNEYDVLIDKIATVSEKRESELSAAEVFLKRGAQKADQKKYKGSIVYFGKAVFKLSKKESQYGMFLALIGLGFSYSEIGLFWAANNCYISAAFISMKEWSNSGKINKRLVECIYQLAGNELMIGRIPVFLSWHEMYFVLARYIEKDMDEQDIPPEVLFDGCLTSRLLNTDFSEVTKYITMPDLLENQGFILSKDCLLYLLGYHDLILNANQSDTFSTEEELNTFFQIAANKPFKSQMIYQTNFLSEKETCLFSKIIGCEFKLFFESNIEMLMVAETLLSFLESFFATALENVFPKFESITIHINEKKQNSFLEFDKKNISNIYTIDVKKFNALDEENDSLGNLIFEFSAHILIHNFYINDPNSFIENLFMKEEINERLSIIINHRKFLQYILGDNLKFYLKDWFKNKEYKEYPLIRTEAINLENERIKDTSDTQFQNNKQRHDKRKLLSIIDIELWDEAGWSGFGVINDPVYGFGFFLCFVNGDIGKKIFDNLIDRIGSDDKNETIRLSIIKGINKQQPYWYRVQIGTNIINSTTDENNIYYLISRIHELTPVDSRNLDYGINVFNSQKKYKLYPASKTDDLHGFQVHFEKGILKRELIIRNAWEINENDFEAMAINKNDEPLIPTDIFDAPILKVLGKKNNQK